MYLYSSGSSNICVSGNSSSIKMIAVGVGVVAVVRVRGSVRLVEMIIHKYCSNPFECCRTGYIEAVSILVCYLIVSLALRTVHC